MSIKVILSSEKTNSFRPTPWAWSTDPFPAFRGAGARYNAFQAASRDYEPCFVDRAPSSGYDCPRVAFEPTSSKVIKTKAKGTLMLVTCPPEKDEQIMLLTLRGGFRGGYGRIEAVGAEVLFQRGGNIHCCPTEHMVVRLTHPNGYVFAETGRRCSYGLVEIFSWSGYQTMPTEEFEVWRESHAPNLDKDLISDAKAKAEAERKEALTRAREQKRQRQADAKAKAEAEAQRKKYDESMRSNYLERLHNCSERRLAIGLSQITLEDSSFYYGDSSWDRRNYTEANVAQAEAKVVADEAKHAEAYRKAEARKAFQPKFEALKPRAEALGLTIEFSDEKVKLDDWSSYSYNNDGLTNFEAKLVEKEKAAEEARQKVATEARYQQLKELGEEAGLPQNIEIWRRTGARTNAGNGWVIDADGIEREPTSMHNPNPRRLSRYGEGYMVWEQILPGEVVLSWSKSCTSAPHEFEVVHMPTEGLTREQITHIAMLEEDIEREWEGARGMSSGDPSPSVGNGWGLRKQSEPNFNSPESGWTIDDLKAKWR